MSINLKISLKFLLIYYFLFPINFSVAEVSDGTDLLMPKECGEFTLLSKESFEQDNTANAQQELSCQEHLMVEPGPIFKINKRPHHLRFFYHFWKDQPEENPHLIPDFRSKNAKVFISTAILKAEESTLEFKKKRKVIKEHLYTILRDNLRQRVENILDKEEKYFQKKKILETLTPEIFGPQLQREIEENFAKAKERILHFEEENPKEQILFWLTTFPTLIQKIKDKKDDPMRPLLCLIENQKHTLKLIKRGKKAFSLVLSASALGAFVASSMGTAIVPLIISVGVLTSLSGGSDFVINMHERTGIKERNSVAKKMFRLEKKVQDQLKDVLKTFRQLRFLSTSPVQQGELDLIIEYVEGLLSGEQKILMTTARKDNLNHHHYANIKNILNLLFGGAKILSGGVYVGAVGEHLFPMAEWAVESFHVADNVGVSFESEIISIIAQTVKNEDDKEIIFDENEKLILKEVTP